MEGIFVGLFDTGGEVDSLVGEVDTGEALGPRVGLPEAGCADGPTVGKPETGAPLGPGVGLSDSGDEEGPLVGEIDTGAALGDLVGLSDTEVGPLTGILLATSFTLADEPGNEIKSLWAPELAKSQGSQGTGYQIASGLVSALPFS